MEEFKSGFVAIVGRTNVGKSTLVNALMDFPISIVSEKPQTTRNAIRFILSDKDFQMVFVDTPGLHKPKNKLGEKMMSASMGSLEDVDVVLFLTDAQNPLGGGDKFFLERLREVCAPVIAVVNKTDRTDAAGVAKRIVELSDYSFLREIVPISAFKKRNLDDLVTTVKKYLPFGDKLYDEDMMTDRSERFITGEIIREKALHYLSDEVPHGVGVEIEKMEYDAKKKITNIRALILTERESHKAIIIGREGGMLKRIGFASRKDIERLLDAKVYLELFVKVKKNWRDDDFAIKELGYDEKRDLN